jgi:hypothetical protein
MRHVRIVNFLIALRQLFTAKNRYYKRTGERLLTEEELEFRLNVCQKCDHFSGQGCALCGCCIGNLCRSREILV